MSHKRAKLLRREARAGEISRLPDRPRHLRQGAPSPHVDLHLPHPTTHRPAARATRVRIDVPPIAVPAGPERELTPEQTARAEARRARAEETRAAIAAQSAAADIRERDARVIAQAKALPAPPLTAAEVFPSAPPSDADAFRFDGGGR